MEACFLSSSFFTNAAKVSPRTRVITHRHRKGCSTRLYWSLRPIKTDENDTPSVESDWRSFRARLVAGERASRLQVPSVLVDLDTHVNQPKPVVMSEKWAHRIHEPEKGCLLIATEKLDGVRIFERAVILLLSTGPVGPSGIILNRPSLMSIKEWSTALDVACTFLDRPLYFERPIEEETFLVSPRPGEVEGVARSGVFEEVMKGVYYGTKESVGCAAEMVKRNAVRVGLFRFFHGSCGWEKSQLNGKIRAGYWAVAACSPNLFGLESVCKIGLWDEIYGLLDRLVNAKAEE